MIAKINQLLEEVGALKAANAEELEVLRIKYLSKKGAINDLMADFRNVAAEQKKEVGMKLNELKTKAQEKINALKEQFDNQDNGQDDLDLTRSAYPVELGTRHPLSIVRNEIIDIFARLGFNIAEGPEIEDDWHVFSALNFAEDHPARDMQDTFFIESHPDVLLRTHTSSVQSRVMEVSQPPIRIICPGRVYRNEAISYRAHCFFHQVEALYVDRDVSFNKCCCSSPKRCSVPIRRFACVRRTSRSQSPAPKWISAVTSAAEKAAPSANTPAGWKSWVAEW